MSFANFHFHAPLFLRVSFSFFWLLLSHAFTLINLIFMLSLFWHVLLSCCSYIPRVVHTLEIVIFSHVKCRTIYISLFWWFQEVIFVQMSLSYHEDIYCTHFRSFKHYHTSVVMVIAKCTFSVTLVVKSLKSCRIEGNMWLTCFR